MTDITPPKATRREWIGLAVIALPCMLYSMDLTVLNLAVPQLTAEMQPTGAQLLWAIDIYGFILAGALIAMGGLGDRMGRRRILLWGAAMFGIVSVIAAFSTSIHMLIVARAFLGLAAATLAPSTLSLIRNMFLDDRERTFAIGIWVSSFSAGGVLGPVIGGVMLEFFWWGSVFLLNAPIMLLLLALGPRLLPEFRDPDAGKPDFISAGMSLLTVLPVIYGIKHAVQVAPDIQTLAGIALGVIMGILFVRRQKHLKDPFLDLALFRIPAFSTALCVNLLGIFIAFGAFMLGAQYLQLVMGLSPLMAGLWTAPPGIAFIVGSMLVSRLTGRYAKTHIMAGGLIGAAVGFVVLTFLDGHGGDLPVFLAGNLIMALGLSFIFTLTTDVVIGSAPPERAGAASGMSETAAELGGALGVAILGTFVAMLYRTTLQSLSAPPSTWDTLGGALAYAETLPADQAARLTETVRDGFVGAFETTMLICAGLALAAALIIRLVFRADKPSIPTP